MIAPSLFKNYLKNFCLDFRRENFALCVSNFSPKNGLKKIIRGRWRNFSLTRKCTDIHYIIVYSTYIERIMADGKAVL